MGFFADSINRIQPSQTIGMSTKARELLLLWAREANAGRAA